MNAKPIIAALLTAALALLLLSGCAPRERIVSAPCVSAADLPPETPRPILTGNERMDLATMTDTALALLDEAVRLRALLTGCVD